MLCTVTEGVSCEIVAGFTLAGEFTMSAVDCGTGDPGGDACISTACSGTDCDSLKETAVSSTLTGGSCCGFNGTAAYSAVNDRWELRQTGCATDSDAVLYLWCDSGTWKFTLECGGSSETTDATIVDLGETCRFTGTMSGSSFGSDCCASVASADISIEFVLEKCCTATDRLCLWTYSTSTGEWSLTSPATCYECDCVTPPSSPGSDGEPQSTECE